MGRNRGMDGADLRAGPTAEALPGKLSALAYDRLEEMIVTCELAPGALLAIHELQQRTGFGRTPVHQAVSRLAGDTLIVLRPRYGLEIAPVDLRRERALVPLRREMERFVVRWAAERAGPHHRERIRHIAAHLRQPDPALSIEEFNRLDRQIDQVLLTATGEAFLENTLRPLHTLFRRIGWIYHCWARPEEGLASTVETHLAILDAVIERNVAAAVAASDRLLDFSEGMFTALAQGAASPLASGQISPTSAPNNAPARRQIVA